MTTLLIGIYFTWCGLMGCLSSFILRQVKANEAIGSVWESVAFGSGLLFLAWILWARPKIGGSLLVIAGISLAVWMHYNWANPEGIVNWILRLALAVIVTSFGIHTLAREYRK